MRPIRVLYCSNQHGHDTQIDDLRERAREARAESGCLEFDYFRDVEFPENFAQLELWESQLAFDRHWQRWATSGVFCDLRNLSAPCHAGAPEYPRRHGNNGAEFYRYQRFQMLGSLFVPADASDRTESVRWPTRSAHRIIIQNSTDPADDKSFFSYSEETRAQKGCIEFAFYRSLEFPENNLHLELWSGPAVIYDEHYYLRTIQQLYGIGLPRPPSRRVDRRYGIDGSEHYEHCFFTLVGDVWEPEEPAERLATVCWP